MFDKYVLTLGPMIWGIWKVLECVLIVYNFGQQ
jgi:hypothetical protein